MAFMTRRLVASDQTRGGVEETQLEMEGKKIQKPKVQSEEQQL